MEIENRSPHTHIAKITIVALIAIGLYAVVMKQPDTVMPGGVPIAAVDLATQPLFMNGLAANGITADTIGFHGFSPDGNYFFMSVYKNDGDPGNHAYLLDLKSQKITELPGILERGFADDSRVLQLFSATKTILYFPDTQTQKSFDLGENIFSGSLSPDGKTYVVNSLTGIKKINLLTDTVSSFSSAQYDGAYVWFSDSNRILGFKESGENLFEAGKGRALGIWNLTDGTFSPLPFAEKNIRSIDWVVPEKIARINVGWDDGSHDYLYNVETKTSTDVGDTSLALMGGSMILDMEQNIFAVIGAHVSDRYKILLYKGDAKLQDAIFLQDEYGRRNLQIVNDHTLLYLRKPNGALKSQTEGVALILYSFTDNTETVLRMFPDAFTILSLAPDHQHWVVSSGNIFSVGTL